MTDMPIRVLLLFPHYGNLNQGGSLRSSQIGNYLVRKGYDVTVIAPGIDLRTAKLFPEVEGRLYSDRDIDGVRVLMPWCLENFRKNMPRRLFFEVLFAVASIFLMLKAKKPDVVIAAYPPAVLPSISLFISKLQKISYIFEIRDLMADALAVNKYSRNKIFNKIAKIIEIYVNRSADHIITVSEGIKKAIMKEGIPSFKITVVKNGYEPQVFKDIDKSIIPRKEFDWKDKFVVVYAGALTQSYDIPTLIKAAELTKDDNQILYAIIGEGERKQSYMDYCSRNKLDNVTFISLKPRKMMPNILSSANVGVHLFPDDPLWDYVLGNKPFDYLGSGLPMIYSGRGDTADLVLDAGAGFVVHPERPNELAEKILWLKKNPEIATKMGQKGKLYVETFCNRFRLLEKLEEVIDKTVATKKKKRSVRYCRT